MRYIALLEQEGEGCDYTIGCGRKWLAFDAPDIEAATEYLRTEIKDNYYHDEFRLRAMTLVPVQGMPIPLAVGEMYAQAAAERAVETAALQRAKDEAEFARLAQKLGR